MKMTQIKKMLSLSVCIVLIAAVALFASGCDKTEQSTVSSNITDVSDIEVTNVGEGNTEFDFTVVQSDGKETKFHVATDKSTVGEALLAEGLIAGEDGAYGLYVKTVNGVTLDYDADGMYWAFYVNGEYASSGVDATEAVSGAEYMFKAEK